MGSVCPRERSQWEVVVWEEKPTGSCHSEKNQWEVVVLGRGTKEK